MVTLTLRVKPPLKKESLYSPRNTTRTNVERNFKVRVNALLLEVEQILAATDPRSLSQAATATAKLQEVEKQLKSLKVDARVERARAYVKEQAKRIKLASIEAV